MSELHRVTFNPEVCGGRPCLRDYPYLEAGDIVAALEFASLHLDHPVLPAAA
jgi:uncharacterized protein (DUF433 family)